MLFQNKFVSLCCIKKKQIKNKQMDLNKVFLYGNIGKDVEVFNIGDKKALKFPMATNESYKKGEDWETETTWHDIVIFRTHEYLETNLKTGSKVFVEGRITKRSWVDGDGNKRYSTSVIADTIKIDVPKKATQSEEKPEKPSKAKKLNKNDNSEDDLPF